MLYHINNIGYDSTGSRELSCSTSVEHCISKYITVYENAIEHTIYPTKRMLCSKHKRCYHTTVASANLAAGCKKLDRTIHNLCIFEIGRRNLGDSLAMDILEIHLLSAHKRSQDCNLTARIVSLDVCGRILLCISLILRIL